MAPRFPAMTDEFDRVAFPRARRLRNRWVAGTVGGAGAVVLAVALVGILGVGRQPGYEAAIGDIDPVAHGAYVRGRDWGSRADSSSLSRALVSFQEALDLGPTYAPAYAGRADAYVQLGDGGFLAPNDAFPKARAAAETALQLDSTLAEPHASLGYYYFAYEWNWERAEAEFQRALALDPGNAIARVWYGLFLVALGRLDEAGAQAGRAVELDPRSSAVTGTAGRIAHLVGKQSEAEALLQRAIALDSADSAAHLDLGRVYQSQGRNREALAQYRAIGNRERSITAVAAMGNLAGAMGDRETATRILTELDSPGRSRFAADYGVALVYAGLGDRDRAFEWLDKAVDQRTHWLVWLDRDRRWDGLRGDERFARLVRRVGLPP